MNYFKPSALIFGLLLLSCHQTDKKRPSTKEETTINVADDKQKLQQLVSQLYEWHETQSANSDFEPIADKKDSIYIGLDLKKHKKRLIELKKSDFFANQFMENYNKIALIIDDGLKNKKLKYFVGELPPYGNGANSWCNSQDTPYNYWKTITINNVKIDHHTAIFNWSWGGKFEYKAKAVKSNNKWRISYLQGFNFNEFIPTKLQQTS